ncbi:hypothetical protein Pelo_4116 [Pelomyxa schiedti]|nr:hypothetical protein Pelo_4116 [Pelomyxa schiedti]
MGISGSWGERPAPTTTTTATTLRSVPALTTRSQLAALATSSHARCGARSPARALWLPGSPFASPSRSFLRRFLGSASFAVLVNAPHPSAKVLSFSVSRALLGVDGAPAGRGPDASCLVKEIDCGSECQWVACSPTHILEYPKVREGEYNVRPLGVMGTTGRRSIGFKDGGHEGVLNGARVSKWMDWAVAYDPEQATVIIVRLRGGGDSDGGGVGCDLDSSSRRVQVSLPERFFLRELLFAECSRDEIVLVGTPPQEESNKEIIDLLLAVVDLKRTFQTKSLKVTTSTTITDDYLVPNLLCESEDWFRNPLLLRKQDGSAAFVFPLPLCFFLHVDSSTGEPVSILHCTILQPVV